MSILWCHTCNRFIDLEKEDYSFQFGRCEKCLRDDEVEEYEEILT